MTTIEQRFPTIFKALNVRGFSYDSYEIPVQPLVHYTLGGIVAKPNGQTNVSGLYAIGECAATGFHGANRLASNSLLEAGIMGQRCATFYVILHVQNPLTRTQCFSSRRPLCLIRTYLGWAMLLIKRWG